MEGIEEMIMKLFVLVTAQELITDRLYPELEMCIGIIDLIKADDLIDMLAHLPFGRGRIDELHVISQVRIAVIVMN